jgi:hypothetical protein
MSHTRFPYLGADQAMPAPYVTGWLKYQGNFKEWDEDNVSLPLQTAISLQLPLIWLPGQTRYMPPTPY